MIERLKKLGLSELEAKCYLELHGQARMTGYEVAKRVSVSRTNVYAALRSLTDKGLCRTIEGDPVLYGAVPIEQVIGYLRSDFEQNADVLVSELKAPLREPAFFNWQGEDKLRMAVLRLIANAESSVLVDIWSEDVPIVESALAEAERRGVDVRVVTLGPSNSRLSNVFVHKRMEWPEGGNRNFSILCDERFALIGSFGDAVKAAALETDHPSIAYMLVNAYYHDMIMMEVEKDFGARLTEAYGEHYDALTERFRIRRALS
ncbi:TrmB family transcriptional regulator [Cohnella zeiphila]|uniref:TrmB family transcriptional regulator n=1 Tax=Cohnella zeiphila TaxID=2761120 RepID=A0A7X0SL59_9BACL|nr:TrmB family transcriptional regulator [Cohnella zeiphila]MBB6729738.1 TrmB family transcriptional regulator [Cohnella zeiphila]